MRRLGRDAASDRVLARAEALAHEADLRVVARMIERQRAILAGKERGQMRSEAELERQGVADAAAWALYLMPGFGGAPGARG